VGEMCRGCPVSSGSIILTVYGLPNPQEVQGTVTYKNSIPTGK
jgi:hypothetical protein